MTRKEDPKLRWIERIGLIGDVHTEKAQLAAALQHLAQFKLDALLCTGDLPDGPGDARDVDACAKLLIEHRVLTISGNHDRWLLDNEMRDLHGATYKEDLASDTLSFLAALPATLEFDSPQGRVLLCHGMGADDMAGVQPHDRGTELEANEALQAVLREDRYRFVLCGHTHRSMQRKLGGIVLINAGTLLSGHVPCCTIVDLREMSVRVYEISSNGIVAPSSST